MVFIHHVIYQVIYVICIYQGMLAPYSLADEIILFFWVFFFFFFCLVFSNSRCTCSQFFVELVHLLGCIPGLKSLFADRLCFFAYHSKQFFVKFASQNSPSVRIFVIKKMTKFLFTFQTDHISVYLS